jgi:E3 ubiquitin-protein ligase UBR2
LQSPGRGWDNDLRRGFLHGVSLLIDILSWMQGMDLQVRQVNQHVEFEFEWESAFNLHMRLAPIFSLILVSRCVSNFL